MHSVTGNLADCRDAMNVSGHRSKEGLRRLIEPLLWGVLGLAAALCMGAVRPLPLSNDSCQYLSVAANLRSGNGIATDLVYFDAERSHGRIPAPLTTFPPGYPAAIALISSLFGSLEAAARFLSAICFAATASVLAWLLIAARIGILARCGALLLFVANVISLDFSTAVLSESIFTLIFLAAIAALMQASWSFETQRGSLSWLLAGMALAGLSYWVRYAGLFLIAAVLFYELLRIALLRARPRASELCSALLPIGLAGALMARNLLLVGTWKGGNELRVDHPWRGVLADFVRAQLHLLLGDHAMRMGVWEALLTIGSLGLAAFLARQLTQSRLGLRRQYGLWAFPFICAAVYCIGLCYAGLHTVISFGTRMFLPVLPLYLLFFALVLHVLNAGANFRGGRLWLRSALLVFVIGYIGVNLRDLSDPRPQSRQDELAAVFSERTASGQRLSDWVNARIAPSAVIAAQDGQQTGYLLHRRTLGLVEAEYSPVRWECSEIRAQMDRFGARDLILYRHPNRNSHLLNESRFAAAAVTGAPGCGFAVAAETPEVRILEIADGSN
jgi:hypothetical protein